MHVVYLNGTHLHLTWHELRTQFRHPWFVGMMLCLSVFIIAIGPYDHLLHFRALQLAIFYACAFGSFLGVLILTLYLCHRWNLSAYSLITVGIAGLGATIVGVCTALLLGAPMPSGRDLILVLGFNLVVCYVGDIVNASFVMPRVLADLRGHKPAPAEPERSDPVLMSPKADTVAAAPVEKLQHVSLFGQTLLAGDVWLIEAEEHYVSITLRDGSRQLLRGRIADAIAGMPEGLGRQTHRSYWVSAQSIAGFSQDRSGAQLVLTDGRTVPVARQRLVEVRCWAESILGPAEKQKAPKRVPSLTG